MNKSIPNLYTLTAIVEGLEDAVLSYGLDDKITSWNKAAETIFGYSPAEIIGSNVHTLIPEYLHQELTDLSKQVCQGHHVTHFHTIRINKKGTEIPLSLTISPIKNDDGVIIGIFNVARDTSKEIMADEKQGMLAAIIESSDDAIISKTLNGKILTWNHGAEEIFGYSESEIIGKSIMLLIPPNRTQEETEIITNIRKGLKVDHFQTTRLHKKGHEVDVSLTVSPIKDLNGDVIGASKIARNITGQKRAEEQVRQHANRLEILNSVGKAISEKLEVQPILQKVTDATTQITGAAYGAFFYNTINEDGEALMLYTLSGAPKEAFEKFGMPRNTAIFKPTFTGEGIMRIDDITKDPRYGENLPYHGMPEGHPPVMSFLSVPVKSTSGEVIGGLFFGHPEPGIFKAEHEDLVVSLASQAAVALDNSRLFEEVKELSHKKDEFIALATHELKTPLTSMSGYLQILRKQIDGEKDKIFVEKSINQLLKLEALITDLFDIAKIQAGKLQLVYEKFELVSFLEEIMEVFRTTEPSHRLNFEEKREIWIEADKARLEQVVINLISNAIKYSPQADKLDIWIENTSAGVSVHIKDYGQGIRKENLKNIFNQFYRIEGLSNVISGLGLGLYITKEIIERHNGKIWVDSEYKKGSIFAFSIPLN